MAFHKKKKVSKTYDDPESLFRDRRNRTVPGLLSHQSDILRRYAEEALNKPDVALELPTGSGKTLVGLLIAEFRRVSRNERALYLCPTKQLVRQVCEQSERKYGITAIPFTGTNKNYQPKDKLAYQTAESIAVTTYSSLFNTNPFFKNPNIIILDDAHSAENYIASTWSLEIRREEQNNIYSGLLSILLKSLPSVSQQNFISNSPDKSNWIEKVSSSFLFENISNIHAFLDENISDNTNLYYPWNFIKGHLKACHIYVSYKQILIRPYIPPSLSHKPFAEATQRILMSATLGSGGDLERISGIPSFHRLPIPDGWDKQGIGRRYFVFPGVSLPDDEIDPLIQGMVDLSGRALVLVPNDKLTQKYRELFEDIPVYSAQDIEASKDDFISQPKGVALLANRYDGIDLLNEDCRLLIIEGLPKAGNLQELFLATRMIAGNLFMDRIRTRIIQAFGRCTRSATDYAAVIILGHNFNDWLVIEEKRRLFHPELQGELIFGIDYSKDCDHDEFLENLEIFLDHGTDWNDVDTEILEYRDETSQIKILGEDALLKAAQYEVKYLYTLWNEDFSECLTLAQKIANILSGDHLMGLRGFWYYLAASAAESYYREYEDLTYRTKAVDLYTKALQCLPALTWIRTLANKLAQLNTDQEQELECIDYLNINVERLENLFENKSFSSPQKFELASKEILESLNSNDAVTFEEAHRRLGEMLGFIAQNSSGQAAPDPWWIANEDLCFVFEDKSDSNPDNAICVKHIRQAASHHKWIKDNVVSLSPNARIFTIMITTQSKIHKEGPTYADEVGWWSIDDFREWAIKVINVLRELQSIFTGAGTPEWRETVKVKLLENSLDPESIIVKANQKLLKDVDIE